MPLAFTQEDFLVCKSNYYFFNKLGGGVFSQNIFAFCWIFKNLWQLVTGLLSPSEDGSFAVQKKSITGLLKPDLNQFLKKTSKWIVKNLVLKSSVFCFFSEGVLCADGDLWKEQRRFTHMVLRDLGMGRGALEPKILEEVEVHLLFVTYTFHDRHVHTLRAYSHLVKAIKIKE